MITDLKINVEIVAKIFNAGMISSQDLFFSLSSDAIRSLYPVVRT